MLKKKISGKLPPPSFWFLFKVFERIKLLIDTDQCQVLSHLCGALS